MDTNTITHVSLCSGYGGIDLGLKRAIGEHIRTVAFVEIEAFAAANLAAKAQAGLLDNAPIWSDLKRFPWGKFHGLVDILSGGYPCQPFSAAGKRLGAEDPRHLWPFIAAGIALMRPSCCFFENVEGHISLGLPDVIEDLAGLGYRTTWGIFSASEVGAPHRRKRVFILAYRHGFRLQQYAAEPDRRHWEDLQEQPQGGCASELAFTSSLRSAAGIPRPQQGHEGIAGVADHCCGQGGGELADTSSQRDRESQQGISLTNQCLSCREEGSADAGRCLQAWPSRPGEQQFAWEPPRVVDSASPRQQAQRDESNGEWRARLAGESGELGNATQRQDHGREPGDVGTAPSQGRCGDDAADGTGEVLGNTNSPRPQERPRQRGAGIQGADADGGEAAERQTQPPLGRDADGPADWLDHAELFTTCDNRTDELRLLGNGVVPATAERAFRVLVNELMEHANQ